MENNAPVRAEVRRDNLIGQLGNVLTVCMERQEHSTEAYNQLSPIAYDLVSAQQEINNRPENLLQRAAHHVGRLLLNL